MGMVMITKPYAGGPRVLRTGEFDFIQQIGAANITLRDGLTFADIDTMLIATRVGGSYGAICTSQKQNDSGVLFQRSGVGGGSIYAASPTSSTFQVAKDEYGSEAFTLIDALIVLKE